MTLFAALEATWPPEAVHRIGPWRLRQGAGGGGRVSSATAEGPVAAADVAALAAAARALGQAPLVMVQPGEAALDAVLAGAGWALRDETVVYAAPAGEFPDPGPLEAFAAWPPLALVRDIWAEGGIGAARQAVMARAAGPKAAVLARTGDRVSSAGFVALAGDTAVLSAVWVRPALRRQGAGRQVVAGAAAFARAAGAARLALAVTAANRPARALYEALGMAVVGQYHYRTA